MRRMTSIYLLFSSWVIWRFKRILEWVWIISFSLYFLVQWAQFFWPRIQINSYCISWSPWYGWVSSTMGTPLLDSAHNHAQSLFVKCLPRTNFMSRAGFVSQEKDCVCCSVQCAGPSCGCHNDWSSCPGCTFYSPQRSMIINSILFLI